MSPALVGVLVADPAAITRVPTPSAIAVITNAEAIPITTGPLRTGGRAACAAPIGGGPVTSWVGGWGCTRSVCRSGMARGGEMAQLHGQPSAGPCAPTLDGSLGDTEQGRGVGHRVPVHIDGDHRSTLPCRQSGQCLTDHDLGFGV